MNEIKELLEEEIKEEIRELSNFEPGSEEKSKAVDDLAKLYKLNLDDAKSKADNEQLKENSKDRYINFGISIAGIVLPIVFYSIWLKKGLKFEETGTYTSTTFKNLIGKFKPTK